MDTDTNIVEIPEYSSKLIEIHKFNKDKDFQYLHEMFVSKKSPPAFTFGISPLKNQLEINNTSYSGVIQLDKTRIQFSTKVKTNLFYMLSFLKDEANFIYDSEKMINIKEGVNFYDILGRLFLNELNNIITKGICKKYINKSENIKYLKGRLLFRKQLQNDLCRKPRFYCSYDDLTYNNLENQIILRATNLLIPLIRFNDENKRDLILHSNILKELVDLVDVVPEDCDNIQYCSLNDYYETIIKFSKIILQNYFIRSIYSGIAQGFNFIVNMNNVYEDFITEIIAEVIEENIEFTNFLVERQERFATLVREKKIITKPDVILRNTETNDYPLIIDAKYKKQPKNPDYYQVIAYALAIPSAKACCLLYPKGEEIENPVLTVDTSPFTKQGREIKLYSMNIDLYLDELEDDSSFKSYIKKIKEQVRSKLIYCLKQ